MYTVEFGIVYVMQSDSAEWETECQRNTGATSHTGEHR